MTVKLMVLLTRKPGMSPSEFRERYEGVHAPLCKRLSPTMAAYRRNYVKDVLVGEHPPCDVITEVIFRDREAFDQAMSSMTMDQLKARLISDDEREQFDCNQIRMFVVETIESDMSPQ